MLPRSRDVRADLAAASEAACAVELRRELATLLGGVARALGLEADDRIERALPAAAAFSGGRVLRVAVSEADGAVRVEVLAAAPGASRGAVARSLLDLADCYGDLTKALDFVVGEVAKAWTQLTRPETRNRAALGDVANARSDSERQVDDYHQGKWVPEAERKKHRKTALERASLAKLHRGRPAYLKALVASAF